MTESENCEVALPHKEVQGTDLTPAEDAEKKKKIEKVTEELPQEEVEKVEEMRLQLELSTHVPDYILVRWLRAVQYDVPAAVDMYRKSQQWRKYKGVDCILDWSPPEVLRKFYPGGFSGWDKTGCPVWIIPLGRADLKGLLCSVSKQDFIDYTLRIIETSMVLMEESMKIHGHPVYQHIFIFDMEGFTLKDATYSPLVEVVQTLISLHEGNYPETLKAAYVINASKIFQLVFNILQRTVNQRTLQKIKVFGQTHWKQALLDEISADNLPQLWGGKRCKNFDEVKHLIEEGDMKQSSSGICLGGEVPMYYRTIRKEDDILGMNSVNKQHIDAGTSFSVKLLFRKSANLAWKFRVDGGEISFSVQRRRSCQKFRPSTKTNTKKSKQISLDQEPPTAVTSDTAASSAEQNVAGSCPPDTDDLPKVSIVPEILVTSSSNVETQVSCSAVIESKVPHSTNHSHHSEANGHGPQPADEDILEVVEETDEEVELVEDLNQPLEDVLEASKFKSGKESRNGYLKCEEGFFYILMFDNSDSLFRGRKLHYSLNIEPGVKKAENPSTTEEEKDFGSLEMDDLMIFVKELLESEHRKKSKLNNEAESEPEIANQSG